MLHNLTLPDVTERETDLALFAIAYPEDMQALCDFRNTLEERHVQPNSPATLEDITAFEQLFGVTLPPNYRMFLRVVGNGIKRALGNDLVEGIPSRHDLTSQNWSEMAEQLQRAFSLAKDEGWSGSRDEFYQAMEDDNEQSLQDDMLDRYDKMLDDTYDAVYSWAHSGTWPLDKHEEDFLVMNGIGQGYAWKMTHEFFQDSSGEIMLTQEGDFIDWLIDKARTW